MPKPANENLKLKQKRSRAFTAEALGTVARTHGTGVAILVSVKTQPPKVVRVNVTLPEDVLEQIDKYAEAHGFTRSGLLTQAVKKLMSEAA